MQRTYKTCISPCFAALRQLKSATQPAMLPVQKPGSSLYLYYQTFRGHQSPYLLPNKNPITISWVPLLTVFNKEVV